MLETPTFFPLAISCRKGMLFAFSKSASPGLIASIHCIAAMPRESLVERYGCDFAINPLHEAIQSCAGRMAVPQGPGLGVEPDAKVIEQLRIG